MTSYLPGWKGVVTFMRAGRPVRYAAGQGRILDPDPRIASEARNYALQAGLPYDESPLPYVEIDPQHAMRVADFYERARHEPHDQSVRDAYATLRRETLAQYQHLERSGVRFEPWEQAGQPYANSREMTRDARNRHLYFFTGGSFPKDHLLAQPSGVTSRSGRHLTYNDLFRAVHDYFGHALYGNEFGPRGEEHAFRTHARMFSPRPSRQWPRRRKAKTRG